MTIKITLHMSEEDAKKLDEAFLAGKLADLGVTSVSRTELSPDGKSWAETELKRADGQECSEGPSR